LGEVSKVLDRQPHHVTHVLSTGKIPEPKSRIANKRLFVREDIERLARHFKVAPNWAVLESAPADADAETPERLTLRPPFDVVSAGLTSHEIKDADGVIFGWAADRGRALVVAGLLEAATRG
jgi:hypothetical protein